MVNNRGWWKVVQSQWNLRLFPKRATSVQTLWIISRGAKKKLMQQIMCENLHCMRSDVVDLCSKIFSVGATLNSVQVFSPFALCCFLLQWFRCQDEHNGMGVDCGRIRRGKDEILGLARTCGRVYKTLHIAVISHPLCLTMFCSLCPLMAF